MTITQLHNLFLQCGGRITTDSRTIAGGEIFFALKGENFDGNRFAIQALQDGAAYCVVSDDSEAAVSGDSRIISFPDTLKALQELATYHRENILNNNRRIRMLALTGTNGKTTTKELVRCVLESSYNITATEGNLNNNIGVPLTLLRLTSDTEIAIVEMGASHPGDIKELVDIAHPDYGLITNVGRAHLLGFGSFEGVKRTKGELYDHILSVCGQCFVNEDSIDLMQMAQAREGLHFIPYGQKRFDAVVLPQDTSHPFLRMTISESGVRYDVSTRLVGSYNAANVLSAIAVGRHFGVPMEAAVRAINAYQPSNNRSQMQITESNTLIIDAYNANPSSMAAALDNFSSLSAQHKALMLGDMLELGEDSLNEHVSIVERIKSIGAEYALLVGGEFRRAYEQSASGNPGDTEFLLFDNSESAAAYLSEHPLSGFTVLVKGSRGIKMEKLVGVL